MEVFTFNTPQEMGSAAAEDGAEAIKKSIEEKGVANIILATGTSQFETLKHLVAMPGIDWSKVTAFHLDEYTPAILVCRCPLWNSPNAH